MVSGLGWNAFEQNNNFRVINSDNKDDDSSVIQKREVNNEDLDAMYSIYLKYIQLGQDDNNSALISELEQYIEANNLNTNAEDIKKILISRYQSENPKSTEPGTNTKTPLQEYLDNLAEFDTGVDKQGTEDIDAMITELKRKENSLLNERSNAQTTINTLSEELSTMPIIEKPDRDDYIYGFNEINEKEYNRDLELYENQQARINEINETIEKLNKEIKDINTKLNNIKTEIEELEYQKKETEINNYISENYPDLGEDTDLVHSLAFIEIEGVDSKTQIDVAIALLKAANEKSVNKTDYISARFVDFVQMKTENPNMTLEEMNEQLAVNTVNDIMVNNLNSVYAELYGNEPDSIETLLEMQDLAMIYYDQEPEGRSAYLNYRNMMYIQYAKNGILTNQAFYNGIADDLVNIFPQQIKMTYEELDELISKVQKLSPEQILEYRDKILSLPSINDLNYQTAYNELISDFNNAVNNSNFTGIDNSEEKIELNEIYKTITGVDFNPDNIIEFNSKLEDICDSISETITYQTALNIFDAVENGNKDGGSALWEIGCLYTGSTDENEILAFLKEITGNENLRIENNTVIVCTEEGENAKTRGSNDNSEDSVFDTVKDWCQTQWQGLVNMIVSESVQEIDANADFSSINGWIDYLGELLTCGDFYKDLANLGMLALGGAEFRTACVAGRGSISATEYLSKNLSIGLNEMIMGGCYAVGSVLDFLQNPEASYDNITNFIADILVGTTTVLGGKYINAEFKIPSAIKSIWNKVKTSIATSNTSLKLTDYALRKTSNTKMSTINNLMKKIENEVLKNRYEAEKGGYYTNSLQRSGLLEIENLPKLTSKHIQDFLEIDKGGQLNRCVVGYELMSAENLKIAPFLKNDIELIRKGIKSTVKEYPAGTKLGRLLEDLPIGEVGEINGKLYMRTGENQIKEIQLSKEMYDKLFPPLERFMINQANSQTCWFLSTCARKYIEPETRYEIVKLFSQVGNDVYINLPNSQFSYKFTGGQVPDLRELGFEDWNKLSNSASWTNMLELTTSFNIDTGSGTFEKFLYNKNFTQYCVEDGVSYDLKNWCISFDNNGNVIFDMNKYLTKYEHHLTELDVKGTALNYFGYGDYLLTGKIADIQKNSETLIKAMKNLPKGKNISMGISFKEGHMATVSRIEDDRIYFVDPLFTYLENYMSFSYFEVFVSHVKDPRLRSIITALMVSLGWEAADAANAANNNDDSNWNPIIGGNNDSDSGDKNGIDSNTNDNSNNGPNPPNNPTTNPTDGNNDGGQTPSGNGEQTPPLDSDSDGGQTPPSDGNNDSNQTNPTDGSNNDLTQPAQTYQNDTGIVNLSKFFTKNGLTDGPNISDESIEEWLIDEAIKNLKAKYGDDVQIDYLYFDKKHCLHWSVTYIKEPNINPPDNNSGNTGSGSGSGGGTNDGDNRHNSNNDYGGDGINWDGGGGEGTGNDGNENKNGSVEIDMDWYNNPTVLTDEKH